MTDCIACGKNIRNTEPFALISLGIPAEDESGWLMKNLITFHVKCALENPVVSQKFKFLLGDEFLRLKVAGSKLRRKLAKKLVTQEPVRKLHCANIPARVSRSQRER